MRTQNAPYLLQRCIANRFHAERQIHEVKPEFLKRGIVNRGGERMLDWIADYAAELSMSVDFHRFEKSRLLYRLWAN